MKYKKPIVLGVLNVSPESKQKDSVAISEKAIIKRARFLRKYDASFIDIGARSTSNRVKKIDEKTELKRLLPAIKLLKENGYKVSVDTWSTNTAIRCLENGADMINFTSGIYDAKLLENLKKYDAWLIMTYMPYNDPYAMDSSKPESFSIKKIMDYFELRIKSAKKYGLKKIIIDPNLGIGHQKLDISVKRNWNMIKINNIGKFKKFHCPVMVAVPRSNNVKRINFLTSCILKNKADFIRTHDPDIVNRLLSVKMVNAYISIGSNINPEENIKKCINLLKSDFNIISISNYYESKPYGYHKQQNFINFVVKINTELSPHKLLGKLQLIEKNLDRRRIIKNGPRTIDLDILLYGSKVINDKDLIIPHKGLLERDFMLIPLLDIDSNVVYPVTEKKIKLLKRDIKYYQILRKIDEPIHDERTI